MQHPRIAAPGLESRLAAVLLGELSPRQDLDDTYVDIILDDLDLDDDYYVSYELVRDDHATTEFVRVRDISRDHIVTVKFPREALDADTLPTPMYSAPYERVEYEEPVTLYSAPSYEEALPMPMYSAPFERVEVDLIWPAEPTDLIAPPASSATRVIAVILVLVGALLLGLAIVMFAM